MTTHDFRAPMWIDAVTLSAASYFYIRCMRSIRGHVSPADIFFPLLLLHWGHCENLIFFTQLCFVTPVVVLSIFVLTIATDRWRSTSGALALSLSTLLMPLNDATGLLLSVPMIL